MCDVHIIILKAPFLYPQKRFDQIVHLTRSSDILSLGNSLLVILITPAPIICKLCLYLSDTQCRHVTSVRQYILNKIIGLVFFYMYIFSLKKNDKANLKRQCIWHHTMIVLMLVSWIRFYFRYVHVKTSMLHYHSFFTCIFISHLFLREINFWNDIQFKKKKTQY